MCSSDLNRAAKELLPGKLERDPDTASRFYNSLSLGHDVALKVDNAATCVESKEPKEVSIVMQGDRPETDIEDFWFLPRGADAHEFIAKVLGHKITRYN